MYGYESWTIKKAEFQRIDAFELCCWKRLLRVPWTGWRSNQSILKGISPEYSFIRRTNAEGPILWPPNAKNWFSAKDHDAGKDWRQEKKGMTEQEMIGWHHQLDGHWVWASSGSWWWTETPGVLQSMGSQSQTRWATELNWTFYQQRMDFLKDGAYMERRGGKKMSNA